MEKIISVKLAKLFITYEILTKNLLLICILECLLKIRINEYWNYINRNTTEHSVITKLIWHMILIGTTSNIK